MPKLIPPQGYDLLGEINPDDDIFLGFLQAAGYERRSGALYHPMRKAIALRDFPSHGTGRSLLIEIVNDIIGQRDVLAVAKGSRFLLRCDVETLKFELYLPAEESGGLRLARCGSLEVTSSGKFRGLDIEVIRERYLPQAVTTLFVGESAPQSGAFFFVGENSMLRQMRLVMEKWRDKSLGGSDEFLETFKSHGWYLDDLVLEPVDGLPKADRQFMCCLAVEGLARRIQHYNPQDIVVLLLGIVPFVKCAVHAARCKAKVHPVHFPGMGFAPLFKADMAAIIESLSRSN